MPVIGKITKILGQPSGAWHNSPSKVTDHFFDDCARERAVQPAHGVKGRGAWGRGMITRTDG
jgi:hypothetical protein